MTPPLQADRCAFAFPTPSEYAGRIGRVSRFDRAQDERPMALVSRYLDGTAPAPVRLFENLGLRRPSADVSHTADKGGTSFLHEFSLVTLVTKHHRLTSKHSSLRQVP